MLQVIKPEAHRNPSDIDRHRGWFDDLASRAQDVVSRDIFFIALVALTIAWVPSYFLLESLEHWHLAFLIPSEVVTLFVVALLANHDRRSGQALQRKVDAIAAALAEIAVNSKSEEVRSHATELRATDGLEDRESTEES